jgi:hypothetical protein
MRGGQGKRDWRTRRSAVETAGAAAGAATGASEVEKGGWWREEELATPLALLVSAACSY